MRSKAITLSLMAAAIPAHAAHATTFVNQVHNGSANGFPSPGPVQWQNLTTTATGTFQTDGGHSSLNWTIGILEPDVLRFLASGFGGSLGGTVSFNNIMTVTLTEQSDFTLIGSASSGFFAGSQTTTISGAGILGVPTEPNGSLRFQNAFGPISLSGTLLPGLYTITISGSAFSAGPGMPGSFSSNLTLTIPAPAAAAPLILVTLALTTRRRRGT